MGLGLMLVLGLGCRVFGLGFKLRLVYGLGIYSSKGFGTDNTLLK